MAFVYERIIKDEDKEYAASKGFTYITGELITNPMSWAIDRERDLILISRGGGGLEMPLGFSLCIEELLVDMEVIEKRQGSHLRNNLQANYIIYKMDFPKEWEKIDISISQLEEIIREAFEAYGTYGFDSSQILNVTVEIRVNPQMGTKEKGDGIIGEN